jgi:uncharacterized membrane protein
MNKSSERNPVADILKGAAVIFMIQVHIMELFAKQEIFNGTIGKISLFSGGPPAAPVFMAVMGYFVFLSKRNLKENVLRGFKLIIGGLLLNVGLNLNLLISIQQGKFNLSPWHYVFGADILPLAGLSIIALVLLKKIFHTKILIYVIILVVVVLISSRLPELSSNHDSVIIYIQAFFWGNIEWSYFPFFPWFAYPLMGFIFALMKDKYAESINDKAIIVSAVPLFIILMITFGYASDITHDLQRYYHHNEIFFLWALAFLIVWTSIFYYITSYKGNNPLLIYLKWLGRNVTSTYVFQWLIIGNIATEIYKTQDILSITLWFTGIVIIVSVCVWGYKLIRLRIN